MPLNSNAVNDILPFATEGSEASGDLMSLNEYATHMSKRKGHQLGTALRTVFNRNARQTSHMAAGIAQFIANRTVAGVVDDGDLDKVESGMESAIVSVIAKAVQDSKNVSKVKTTGNSSSTGFTLADDTDLANIFMNVNNISLATSGTGNFVQSVAVATAGNKITVTQNLGTVAYCTYCAASTYCTYCSYCNYCGYCSYCTYCNCHCACNCGDG